MPSSSSSPLPHVSTAPAHSQDQWIGTAHGHSAVEGQKWDSDPEISGETDFQTKPGVHNLSHIPLRNLIHITEDCLHSQELWPLATWACQLSWVWGARLACTLPSLLRFSWGYVRMSPGAFRVLKRWGCRQL